MAYDFLGAWNEVDQIGDRMAQRKRQARMDEAQAGERAYQHNKDSSEASRQALEDQRKEELSDSQIEENMARAWSLRHPQERPGPRALGEQAVGAKLKELGTGIEDINAREEGMKKWYLPSFMEDKIDPAEAQMRKNMESRRMQLLGMSGGAPIEDRMSAPPPAPGGSVPPPAQVVETRAQRIARMRAQGKGR